MSARTALGKSGGFLWVAAAVASFLPWLVVQMETAVNTNHAWLSVAAGRLLDGGQMLTDFYDPDPPLSVLVYVPVVLMARLFDVPVFYAPYVFGCVWLLLSAFLIMLIARAWPEFGRDRTAVLVMSYLASCTYLSGVTHFGDRDEMVMWGLLPFLFAQLSITYEKRVARSLLWLVLVLGIIGILIKPHYGLLPVILLGHRIIYRRKLWRLLRDADFIALSFGSLAYIVVIFLFFNDYLTVIFPGMLGLYVTHANDIVPAWWMMTAGIIVSGAMLAALLDLQREHTMPIYLLLGAGFISSLLYLIQMKGFFYHLIPTIVFSGCAAGLFFHALLCRYMKRAGAAHIVAAGGIVLLSIIHSPLQRDFPTHREYADLRLSRMVKECAPDCSYLVISGTMEMVHQPAIYTGAVWGSRFPLLWWLPGLATTPDTWGPRVDFYADMVGSDLERYRPAVIAVAVNQPVNGMKNFDYIGFLSKNETFRREFSRYKKTGQLHDNRRDYFRDTGLDFDYPIIYDIYRRG